LSHVFEIQIKTQGRVVIPKYVREAAQVKDGDWIVIQLDKIDKEALK